MYFILMQIVALIDQYNMGWKNYLSQREQDEHRRKRERANAQKKAQALMEQANKNAGKRQLKAVAAQQMIKRAERMMRGLEDERQTDKVAAIRFPEPAPCGKTPLSAQSLSKSYGSLEIFTDVDLAIDRGSRVVVLGLNGAGKLLCYVCWLATLLPTPAELSMGMELRSGISRRNMRFSMVSELF